ncbi:MAG: hypothetical protein IJ875_03855 [Solobacterium sp.]|nr:hypothetical protein [Solobacterium sp.]
MFEKKVTIYKKKDRETWEKIKEAFRKEGFKDYKAKHYYQETVQACGCGSKLDPRDFAGKGKLDREIYVISVKRECVVDAYEIIRNHGLVAEVDETVTWDAKRRAEAKMRQEEY